MTILSDDQIERALLDVTNADALRAELGDKTYRELHALAVELSTRRAGAFGREAFAFSRAKESVILLPGILGSRLSVDEGARNNLIWFDPLSLSRGQVYQLKYNPATDGVVPSGAFISIYGRLICKLALEGYRVKTIAYDWRRPTDELGAIVHRQIVDEGGSDVTVIAHSMGGLLARHIATLDSGVPQIRQFITIGTPNGGSYSPVMVFRNAHNMVTRLDRLDPLHTAEDIIRDVLRDFPGLVEMMPEPARRPGEDYFDYKYWPDDGLRPLATVLEAALATHGRLPAPDDRFHHLRTSGLTR